MAALLAAATLGFGGCAQQPQRLAASTHGKEYFPSSVYGAASRRVVESGPIPHGGGQYLVGKPYTVAGQTYYPSEKKLVQVGNASWYGDAFHGRLTANGEIYDRDSFTAAHPTMPLPSYARVTNLRNKASMIVRVNDRGPFASNRVMDVSRRVAEALDFKRTGTARIKVEYVGKASLAGSDDAKLYATLRTNGPAQWHEPDQPSMMADAAPPPPVIAPPVEAPVRMPPPMERPARSTLAGQDTTRQDATGQREDPDVRLKITMRPAPRGIERPAPVQRPVHVAAREPTPPRLRWEPGPIAKTLNDRKIAWAPPKPLPLPVGRPFQTQVAQTQVARTQAAKATGPKDGETRMARAPLPPMRPLDLGTIPGAGVPIASLRHAPSRVRVARSHDD